MNQNNAIRYQLYLTLLTLVIWSAAFARDPKRIAIVSSEHSDVHYTGGLGAAVAEVAQAYRDAGYEVDVILPGYQTVKDNPEAAKTIKPTGQSVRVDLDRREDGKFHKSSQFEIYRRSERGKPGIILLDHRPPEGEQNYFENHFPPGGRKNYGPVAIEGEAFGAFNKAAVEVVSKGKYDVVIATDWGAGLVPYFIEQKRREGKKMPATIGEVHNTEYQGNFPPSMIDFLGMDHKDFNGTDGKAGKTEFYGKVSFLKTLLEFSDVSRTVSLTHSKEVTTPRFGHGLEGIISELQREFRWTGVPNGIDETKWDPKTKHGGKLPYAFSPTDFSGKASGKKELQERFFGPSGVDASTPLVVMTSRIARQKGWEYLGGVLEAVLNSEPKVQILIAGDGEDSYLGKIRELESRFPGKIKRVPFSAEVERLATAYGDFFVNTSRHEPSGLNQLYALKNGTIPIVTGVGGLVDSVSDGVTGYVVPISYHGEGEEIDIAKTQDSIVSNFKKALGDFRDNPSKTHEMRIQGMAQTNTWKGRVPELVDLMKYVMARGPRKLSRSPHAAAPLGLRPSDLLKLVSSVKPNCPGLEGDLVRP